MAKEGRADLAIAYIKKGLLAVSNYADLQLRVIERLADIITAQGTPTMRPSHLLQLISQFSVVVHASKDVFGLLLRNNAELRQLNRKDT